MQKANLSSALNIFAVCIAEQLCCSPLGLRKGRQVSFLILDLTSDQARHYHATLLRAPTRLVRRVHEESDGSRHGSLFLPPHGDPMPCRPCVRARRCVSSERSSRARTGFHPVRMLPIATYVQVHSLASDSLLSVKGFGSDRRSNKGKRDVPCLAAALDWRHRPCHAMPLQWGVARVIRDRAPRHHLLVLRGVWCVVLAVVGRERWRASG